MNDFREYQFEELLAAEKWTKGSIGEMRGNPIAITEHIAIELALRAICGINGKAYSNMSLFSRPDYKRRPSYVRQRSGLPGPDEWGWSFWFPFPLPPSFEGKSFPVFVNDPSGIVEWADAV